MPDGARPHLIESLEDNGQFSVTIEEYPAHETYQFKGRYVRHRRVDGDDIDVANRVRERFVSSVIQLFGEAAAVPVKFHCAPAGRGTEGSGTRVKTPLGANSPSAIAAPPSASALESK